MISSDTRLKATSLSSMPAFAPSSVSWRSLSVGMLAMFTIVAIVTTDVGFVVSINGALFGSGACAFLTLIPHPSLPRPLPLTTRALSLS